MQKAKNIGILFAIGAVVLLSTLVFSSSGLATTESFSNDGLEMTDSTRDPCHIYGNVYYLNGSRACGVAVNIWVWRGPYGGWTGPTTVTTGPEWGDFSWDTYLADGFIVRCASLGDVEEREWPGGAYMYFRLDQQKIFRCPYELNNPPVDDP
jgi:hypothetical protein